MPTDEGDRWRVFLAVEVPDGVRAALRAPFAELEPLSALVRVNPVERMHLTLHFLGHLPLVDVEQLPAALEPIVAAHRRLRLAVQGVGAFPGIGRPQVLWAGITGPDLDGLIALREGLGRALRAARLATDDRFHPHLTLARVRRPPRGAERKVLRDWASRWEAVLFGDLPVNVVQLMRSQLGAGPPRYTTLATFALQ
jgi:RNA 2',3'-cyclic 3'-phosphodiesterase